MTKKKSITWLIIILVLVLIFSTLAVMPIKLGDYKYTPPIKNIPLGIELSGGVYAVLDLSVPMKDGEPLYAESELSQNVDATIDILKNRLLSAGYSEATVVLSGDNRVRVEVADVGTGDIDADDIFEIIGAPAVLEFKDSEGNLVISGQQGHIKKAEAGYNSQTNEYGVYLELNAEGTKAFAEATAANVGKPIIISIDGRTISSPTVNSRIDDGKPVISGGFTAEQAQALAVQIQGGALTVDVTFSEQSNTSATLGADALSRSLMAGIIGLALVFLFMLFVYRGLGLVADIALAIYTLIVIFLLGTLPIIQLSLAGIAGIVLSIGMAVDANVVIFERIKDEYALGKSVATSVQNGFKRATAAIVDANITTLIACGVLYFFGSAIIKSFAITLFIGIIVSLFTAMVVTRLIANIFLGINKKNNKFYGLNAEVKING